jgi:hypothetical protein
MHCGRKIKGYNATMKRVIKESMEIRNTLRNKRIIQKKFHGNEFMQ